MDLQGLHGSARHLLHQRDQHPRRRQRARGGTDGRDRGGGRGAQPGVDRKPRGRGREPRSLGSGREGRRGLGGRAPVLAVHHAAVAGDEPGPAVAQLVPFGRGTEERKGGRVFGKKSKCSASFFLVSPLEKKKTLEIFLSFSLNSSSATPTPTSPAWPSPSLAF